MLSRNDLAQIKLLLTDSNSQLLKEFEEVKESLEEVKNQIRYLPTKEEYFSSMDRLMKEVRDARDEQKAIGHRLSEHSDKLENHEERIGKLETKASFPTI